MMRPRPILLVGLSIFAAGCATKGFVRDQVRATDAKLTREVESQESKLRETADQAAASRQAIDAADRRLQGLDARVGQLDTAANDAQARADLAAKDALLAAKDALLAGKDTRDAEARLSQRIADRNKYRLVETRFVYFDSGRADILASGVGDLEAVAKTLQADTNAIAELQGFADPRGSDRYNDELARDRVEAVIRQLVRRGIELRQIRSVAMGKVALTPGEKPTSETLANARRVEIRLITPWSSWEDTQTGIDRGASEAAPSAMPAQR
jgi:outer membrane protein OmpA-like peptidoglycan-associated protein